MNADKAIPAMLGLSIVSITIGATLLFGVGAGFLAFGLLLFVFTIFAGSF